MSRDAYLSKVETIGNLGRGRRSAAPAMKVLAERQRSPSEQRKEQEGEKS